MFVRKLNPHLAEVRRLLQAALRQHGGAAAAGGGSAGKPFHVATRASSSFNNPTFLPSCRPALVALNLSRIL
jgi:hypothetical protein